MTVAEVKKQLNISTDYTDDDDYIQALIDAAIDFVEGEIAADIEETTNILTLTNPGQKITAKYAPFLSLISVDIDGESVDIESVEVESNFATTVFTLPESGGDVKIMFNTGYADEDIPAGIRQAVIIKAASLYDAERSDMVVGTIVAKTNVIDSLLTKHKRKYY